MFPLNPITMIKKLVLLLYLCCSFSGTVPTVTDDDKATLALMREEEKLARDVYLTLNEKWDQVVFQHISGAEITHMKLVKTMMDKYGVDDPVARTKDKRGKFVNQQFQDLYKSLTSSGLTSMEQAFRVGAYVEEWDLKDLYRAEKATKSEDLQVLYGQLIRASEQHLRAFTRNLQRAGQTYEPVILPKDKYELIISTGGPGGGMGQGRGQGMGPGAKATANGEACPPECPHRKAGCFQEQ